MLNDEKESVENRVFAVQTLGRVKSAEAEDSLIRVVSKKDLRLSYPALKTLALTGTAKTFGALSAIGSLPLKSLERQKDFAMLLIGYRLQLPGTEPVLDRLLKAASEAPKRAEEFGLKFQAMKPEDISAVTKQTAGADFGIALSPKMAFQVDVGNQRFYFYFSSRFDNPAAWEELLKTRQVAGQLFRKEPHTSYVSQQYIALATPVKDAVQLSFFRRNGELFMLANVTYDKAKKSFSVSNVKEDPAKNTVNTELRLDQASPISMKLSYIRRQQKRAAGVIQPDPVVIKRSAD